jgi:hypothetical protein
LAAGVFSFGIGWLGEIPAGAVLGTGMILWGAGDALDTTVDWAEGGIGGRELAFGAGLAVATAFAGGLAVKFDHVVSPDAVMGEADRQAGPSRRQARAGEHRGHRPRPER